MSHIEHNQRLQYLNHDVAVSSDTVLEDKGLEHALNQPEEICPGKTDAKNYELLRLTLGRWSLRT